MADYTVNKSKHATLTSTDEDVVTMTWRQFVEVLNRSGTADLTVRVGGAGAPDPDGDDTEIVPAGTGLILEAGGQTATGVIAVHVVGDGNAYSVTGMSAVA